MVWLSRFTTGGIPADGKGATMVERISRGYFGYSYRIIEAQITFFFRSKIINLSFSGLAYNVSEHFVSLLTSFLQTELGCSVKTLT